MQRIKNMLFAFGISVIFIANVGAASVCTNAEQAELRTAAGNIRATYEEAERTVEIEGETEEGESTGTFEVGINYLKINIVNLTEKFYAVVSNDYDNTKNTYHYSDTEEGILSIDWENTDKVTTFTIKVYSSDNTGCQDELYRTITTRLPKFNNYYNSTSCMKYPEFELCQKWVMFNDIPNKEFSQKITSYVNELEGKSGIEYKDSLWERIKDFIADNKNYFIGGGIVLIVAAGVAVVVIVKRKRSLDL